ncbi:MAG: hypothetical protein ACK5NK_09610 [Niabella sp.]
MNVLSAVGGFMRSHFKNNLFIFALCFTTIVSKAQITISTSVTSGVSSSGTNPKTFSGVGNVSTTDIQNLLNAGTAVIINSGTANIALNANISKTSGTTTSITLQSARIDVADAIGISMNNASNINVSSISKLKKFR